MRDIDSIIAQVRVRHPLLKVDQLKVAHPGADDDGIWYFSLPGAKGDIQLESSSGNLPFLVESDSRGVEQVTELGQAVDAVDRLLRPEA